MQPTPQSDVSATRPTESSLPDADTETTDLQTRLENLDASARLRWAAQTFGYRAAIGTSFQGAGIVALHLAREASLDIPAFTLDTGLLFPETLALKAEIETRLNIVIENVRPLLDLDAQARDFGPRLWETDPDLCCELRKVQPLQEKLSALDCWITGVRREQSTTRAETPVLERTQTPSGRILWKLNPLADWTRDQVWAFIRKHDLPYNALHDRGYRSIGCSTCTRPGHTGDADERAGRWSGFGKTECGIHTFLKTKK
jgi:phosphoadenosine phosphosulfate reductase